jgi:phage anti-repressor protein
MADFITGTSALIPVFTGTLSDSTARLCDARTLHAFLQVKRDFTNWIKGRIRKFGFIPGVDFIEIENLSSPDLASSKSRAQKLTDYHLTLDMAKELSMVENNDMGRQARRYFIACEAAALNPARISPAQPASLSPALDSIDVRALLLSGQGETVQLTRVQQAALERHAWMLAHEAYELVREHIERRVACNSTPEQRSNPANHQVYEVIKSITLGNALVHKHHTQINHILRTSKFLKSLTDDFFGDMSSASQKGGAA